MKIGTPSWLGCVAAAALSPGGAARAQQAIATDAASATGDESDIVVTALKREQGLQQVPASVSTLSEDLLTKLNAADFSRIADSVPGVAFATTGLGNSQYIVRGIGSVGAAQSPLTGVYLDETPLQSRALRGSSQADPQLFDVARIEILRGPQGVLYGSSAMGGLVRIVTNQPDPAAVSGRIEGSVGTINDGSENWDVKAVANLPLVRDVLALRVVGSYVRQGGWIDDLRPTTADLTANRGTDAVRKDDNWTDYKTVRAALRWNATPTLTITPSLIYQDGYSNSDRTFSDISFGLRAREKARYQDTYSKDRFAIGTLLIRNDLDALGGASLVSTSSYMDRRTHLFFDVTAFYSPLVEAEVGAGPGGRLYPTPLQDISHTRQFTQEVRLVSTNAGPFQYVAGAFYRHMNQHFARTITAPDVFGATAPLPLGASDPAVIQDIGTAFRESEIAGFGELTYALTGHLKASAGVRVFRYRQRERSSQYGVGGRAAAALDYAYAEKNAESGATPRFTLSYEPGETLALYASYAEGFRTGGVNAPITDDICSPAERRAAGLPDTPPPYRSDNTETYEIGAKSRLLGGKLRVNGALYKIDWKNFQQAFQTTCGVNDANAVSFIVNAGKVRSRGGELEIALMPVAGLSLSAGGSYTDATYRNAVPQLLLPAGARVLDVPRINWNARADYAFPIADRLSGDLFFAARHVGGSDSGFGEGEVLHRPAYTLLDLSAGVTTAQRWSIDLFVNNVTDAIPVYGAEFATSPDATTATSSFAYHVGPPRTIGVRISKAFF